MLKIPEVKAVITEFNATKASLRSKKLSDNTLQLIHQNFYVVDDNCDISGFGLDEIDGFGFEENGDFGLEEISKNSETLKEIGTLKDIESLLDSFYDSENGFILTRLKFTLS